jgi:hypothetical protein
MEVSGERSEAVEVPVEVIARKARGRGEDPTLPAVNVPAPEMEARIRRWIAKASPKGASNEVELRGGCIKPLLREIRQHRSACWDAMRDGGVSETPHTRGDTD